MAYEIHIERRDGNPIDLAEWQQAVTSMQGMRLAAGNASIQNPLTGQTITVASSPGDVELYFPASDEWLLTIRFSGGRGSFKANADFEDVDSRFYRCVNALSLTLEARLVGDEGEVYD